MTTKLQLNSSTTCSINLKFALDKYFEKLLESSKKTLVDTQIFIQKFDTVLKNVDDRQIFVDHNGRNEGTCTGS